MKGKSHEIQSDYVKKLAGWLIAGIFALGLAITAIRSGRQSGRPPGPDRPSDINPKRADRARQTSEARLRTAELGAAEEAENQKHIQAAIANMKQDFTRIQVLRNDIARNLVAHKPLDYNLITEQTAEINKRAHRLNVYMLAHAPENKEQNSTSGSQERRNDRRSGEAVQANRQFYGESCAQECRHH